MNILIITEYIAPVNEIAAIRWTKLGKYLSKNHGCKVDILTTQKGYDGNDLTKTQYGYDESITSDLKFFNNIIEFPNTILLRFLNFFHNHIKKSRKKAQSSKKPIINDINNNPHDACRKSSISEKIFDIYYWLSCSAHKRSVLRYTDDWHHYDVIISTYGPYWPHYKAIDIKRSNPNTIWIADYRDPVTDLDLIAGNSDLKYIENVATYADCILSISEGIKDRIAPESLRSKLYILPNGYDSAELQTRDRKRTDKFIVSYTGTLYNTHGLVRDLTPLFMALEDLINEDTIDDNDLEFCYCGISEDEFLAQVAPYKTIKWKSFGVVPRPKALEIQDRSSLLALCTWNTLNSQGIITGKVFEYLMSGVPIISLCSGDLLNAEMGKIVNSAHAGFSYEESNKEEDYQNMKRYIKEKYEEWKKDGITSCNINRSCITRYDHKELAKNLYLKIVDFIN